MPEMSSNFACSAVASRPHEHARQIFPTDSVAPAQPAALVDVALVFSCGRPPVTGGEKAMEMLLGAVRGRGWSTVAICHPGGLRQHLVQRGQSAHVADYLLPAADDVAQYKTLAKTVRACQAPRHSPMPADLVTAMRALDGLAYERLNSADEDLSQTAVRAALAARVAVQLGTMPADAADDSVDPDVYLNASRAVAFRRSLCEVRPRICLTDLDRDADNVLLACAGTDLPAVRFVQNMDHRPASDARLLAWSAGIITCGAFVKRSRFADDPRVTAIPNGVDLARYRPLSQRPPAVQAARPVPPHQQMVLTAGSLDAHKQPGQVVRAFAGLTTKYPHAQLMLAGGIDEASPYVTNLRRTIADSRLSARVHLLGARDDLETLMPHANVFVHFSRAEGLPLVVLEARASGVPFVGSDIGPHRELAGDGMGGAVLIHPDDVAGPTSELARLLTLSPDTHRDLGEAGHSWIAEHFSLERQVNGVAKFLRSTLEVASARGREAA